MAVKRNRSHGSVVLLAVILACCTYDPIKPANEDKARAAQFQIQAFCEALRKFRSDTGRFPTVKEGLNALVSNPGLSSWRGPYLASAVPNDPWGHSYEYRHPGLHGEGPDITSFGADGMPGGEGFDADIVSSAGR